MAQRSSLGGSVMVIDGALRVELQEWSQYWEREKGEKLGQRWTSKKCLSTEYLWEVARWDAGGSLVDQYLSECRVLCRNCRYEGREHWKVQISQESIFPSANLHRNLLISCNPIQTSIPVLFLMT